MTSYRLLVGLLLLAFMGTVAHSETTGIAWNTNYGTAKRIAQATKRPLLVVIENSKSKASQIDEKSLDGTPREKLLRQDFELVRVDANTDYGRRVAKAFGVQSFPYTAVTDGGSKRIVFRKSGPMSKSDWTLALAKSEQAGAPVGLSSSSIGGQVISQPSAVYPVITQPMNTISTELFAPNGFYQPAGQCFT